MQPGLVVSLGFLTSISLSCKIAEKWRSHSVVALSEICDPGWQENGPAYVTLPVGAVYFLSTDEGMADAVCLFSLAHI